MLTGLYIQDIVLIDRLSLSLGGGLTALTGETGAGKSIMLDALGLATGARAEKGLVRRGAEQGVATASFEPPRDNGVWELLAENGLDTDGDDTVILRRVLRADGRAKAFVNDQPVSLALMRQVAGCLIEVHGQHAGQGFLETSAHRQLLDDFAGVEKDVQKVATAWEAVRALEERRATQAADQEAALREADWLRHVVGELEKLAPESGEESRLAEERAALMALEKVAQDLADAQSVLADDASESRLFATIARLDRAGERLEAEQRAALTDLLSRTDSALTELQEARLSLSQFADRLSFDVDDLERVEERLFALRAAARKYNVAGDQLDGYLEKVRTALDLAEAGETTIASLDAEIVAARTAFGKAARVLSDKRRKHASRLEKAVAAQLTPLKLDKARFFVSIETDEELAGPHGTDRVQFQIATNPGADPGPLKQIASGGELSRFVLALKAALMAKDNKTVIIFDEVDSGIGGAVADAVGERLAVIAEAAQVLVVTHSPQVAARASAHFLVSKSGSKEVTTRIDQLTRADRVEEIARMLSGAEVTDEARAAAGKLLAPARGTAKAGTRKRKKSAA